MPKKKKESRHINTIYKGNKSKKEREKDIANDFENLFQEDTRKELKRLSSKASRIYKKLTTEDYSGKEYRKLTANLIEVNSQYENYRISADIPKRVSKTASKAIARSGKSKGIKQGAFFFDVNEFKEDTRKRFNRQIKSVNGVPVKTQSLKAIHEIDKLARKLNSNSKIVSVLNPETGNLDVSTQDLSKSERKQIGRYTQYRDGRKR